LSDEQFQRFRELAPPAELKPMTIPWGYWSLLKQSCTVYMINSFKKILGQCTKMLKIHLENKEASKYELQIFGNASMICFNKDIVIVFLISFLLFVFDTTANNF
jgi:hypothetical protein